jgi:hypothetical protein
MGLGLELQVSHLLGRHSTAWVLQVFAEVNLEIVSRMTCTPSFPVFFHYYRGFLREEFCSLGPSAASEFKSGVSWTPRVRQRLLPWRHLVPCLCCPQSGPNQKHWGTHPCSTKMNWWWQRPLGAWTLWATGSPSPTLPCLGTDFAGPPRTWHSQVRRMDFTQGLWRPLGAWRAGKAV